MEKRRCKNCGAFLGENDKVCYVCGQLQTLEVVSGYDRGEAQGEPSVTFEKDEDFVVPVDSEIDEQTRFENRKPYSEEDYAEPYFEDDERRKKARRKRNKGRRITLIAVIAVLFAGILGAVCFCYFNGVFDGGNQADNKITIYFDKPKSDIELKKTDGTICKWSNDVEIAYTIKDKDKTAECTPCADHETLWKIKLPAEAKSIYFYENTDKSVKTQVLPSFEDDTVYYVSQENFNAHNRLPVGQCARESFEGIGINYAETSDPSEEETSESTEKKTEETDEFPTEDETSKTIDNGIYTVNLPKSWKNGVISVEKDNCTVYYEEYNYNMYYMGRLVTIYVFDANDSEADNLSGVKDIRYNSDQTKKVIITTPTDVQFNDGDETAQEKYLEKNKDLNKFLDSVSVE